jgi:hypothetical protein
MATCDDPLMLVRGQALVQRVVAVCDIGAADRRCSCCLRALWASSLSVRACQRPVKLSMGCLKCPPRKLHECRRKKIAATRNQLPELAQSIMFHK